jgi:heme-degrading monooxygenase HmoA
MAIKIIIKRRVPDHLYSDLSPLLKKLRVLAMSREGYISGETLRRVDDPVECLVISTWQSLDDWRQWLLDDERVEIQKNIDALLGQETVYEIYSYA